MDVDPHTMTLPLHNRKGTTPKHPFPFHVTSKARKRREINGKREKDKKGLLMKIKETGPNDRENKTRERGRERERVLF